MLQWVMPTVASAKHTCGLHVLAYRQLGCLRRTGWFLSWARMGGMTRATGGDDALDDGAILGMARHDGDGTGGIELGYLFRTSTRACWRCECAYRVHEKEQDLRNPARGRQYTAADEQGRRAWGPAPGSRHA